MAAIPRQRPVSTLLRQLGGRACSMLTQFSMSYAVNLTGRTCGPASTSGRQPDSFHRRGACLGRHAAPLRLDQAAQQSTKPICTAFPRGAARQRLQTPAAVGAAEDAAPAAPKRRGRAKKTQDDAGPSTPPLIDLDVLIGLPVPNEFQQTLFKSFTLSGIGLHTGEPAIVRVRPAHAGEGRYFIRVPQGTLAASSQPLAPELDDAKQMFFDGYLESQEGQGYKGSFLEYLAIKAEEGLPLAAEMYEAFSQAADGNQWTGEDPEPIQDLVEGDDYIPAVFDSIPEHSIMNSTLSVCQVVGGAAQEEEEGGSSTGDWVLIGSEMLLAALEACGVDNARIEIEGSPEIPILDGSALSWVMEIQSAGLRAAPLSSVAVEQITAAESESGITSTESALRPSNRRAARPRETIVVRDGDAFVSLVPEDAQRLTVGVDHTQTAEVIGKQWFTWCMHEDGHFRFDLAGARQYAESPQLVQELRDMGLYLGATSRCMLIADGERWVDSSMVRHVRDEQARHAMLDLIGDLALNGANGNCGIPVGHIIAYKTTHALNLQFLKALREATTEEDWVPMVAGADDDSGDEEDKSQPEEAAADVQVAEEEMPADEGEEQVNK